MEKVDNTKELKLNFPTTWQYKLIMEKEHDAKKIAKEILKDKEHKIKKSQNSKKGNYTSHTLEVLVDNHEERKAIFEDLKKHKKIKFVL